MNKEIKWDKKAVKNFENYLKQAGMLFGEIIMTQSTKEKARVKEIKFFIK